MRFKKIGIVVILNIMLSVSAFLDLNPYFIWKNHYIKYLFVIPIFIIVYYLILLKKIKIEKHEIILIIFAIFIIIYFKDSGLVISMKALVANIPILVYILIPKESKEKVYVFFTYIFAIALVPSMLIYALNLLNMDLKWVHLEALNPIKTSFGIFYKQYFGAVTYQDPAEILTGGLYRLCGMFDEPGVVGTMAVLILVAEEFQIKKNYKNIVILIGGILSFSLAFYLMTIIYFFLSFILRKEYKTGKKSIAVFVLLSIILVFASGIVKNEFINTKVIDRMTVSDGKLKGDNRSSSYLDYRFNEMLKGGVGNMLFGMGSEATHSDSLIEADASWKKLVYESGFLGLGMIVIFLITATFFTNRKINGIIFFIILFISMYQRPGVFNLSILIVFIGGLSYQSSLPDKIRENKHKDVDVEMKIT